MLQRRYSFKLIVRGSKKSFLNAFHQYVKVTCSRYMVDRTLQYVFLRYIANKKLEDDCRQSTAVLKQGYLNHEEFLAI